MVLFHCSTQRGQGRSPILKASPVGNHERFKRVLLQSFKTSSGTSNNNNNNKKKRKKKKKEEEKEKEEEEEEEEQEQREEEQETARNNMKEACPLLSPGNCNSFSWPAPFLACSSCLLLSARYPTLLHRMQVSLHWIKHSFPTTNRAPEGCFPAKERHPPNRIPKVQSRQLSNEMHQYVENSGFLARECYARNESKTTENGKNWKPGTGMRNSYW